MKDVLGRAVMIAALAAGACKSGGAPAASTPAASTPPPAPAPAVAAHDDDDAAPPDLDGVPPHLRRFPGLSVRSGDTLVPAPEADVAVARGYPTAPGKGAWVDGRRITILTASLSVRAGQPVRIIHVVESIRPGDALSIMGPKPVLGEMINGYVTKLGKPPAGDPLVPAGVYDGRRAPAPAVDYNYDITEYKLEPGRYTIAWQLGPLRSNDLAIYVGP